MPPADVRRALDDEPRRAEPRDCGPTDEPRAGSDNELRALQQRLEFLISATPAVFYTAAPVLPFSATFISDNVAAVLGYLPDRFTSRPDFWLEHIHAEDREAVLREYARVLERGEAETEYRFLHADGDYRWMHESARLVRHADGTPREIVGYWTDITQQKHAERAVRHSEARFRGLIEKAAEIIVVLDAEGEIVYASPANRDVIGYAPAGLLQRNAFEFVHPDDLPGVSAQFARLAARPGESVVLDFRFRHADGRWLTLEVTGTNLLHDAAVGGVVINARDMTERLESQRALRLRERQLAEAQRIAQLGSWEWHPESDALEWSDEHYRIFGYSPDEVTPDIAFFLSHVHPDDRAAVGAEVYTCVDELRSYSLEFRVVRRDGAVRRVHSQGAFIREAAGVRAVGTIQDVTARVEAERRLRASEQRYREVFEHDLTAGFVSTPAGALLECNPAFLGLFGFESVEQARQADVAALHEATGGRAALLEELREGRKVERREVRMRRRDGSLVEVLLSKIPRLDEAGRLDSIFAYLVDVSEQKRLEAQLRQVQKMEAVGQMAGGIAHDFNNVLTAVKGHATLLLETLAEADPLRESVVEIDRAAERAAGLTRQLLAFSRKQVLQPRVLRLDETIGEMQGMLRRLLGESVALEVVSAPGLQRVKADPGQVQQVVMNLAVNARDAMPQGGTLTVRLENAVLDAPAQQRYAFVQPGAYVMLRVSDSGTGIAPEAMPHLFEPFFTTKEPGCGTGLGLSTVYGIVKQSGGYVWAESEPGGGATFFVCFPVTEEAATAAPQAAALGALPTGSGTILLAEDEDAVRVLARQVLQRAGYKVLVARSGEEALLLAEQFEGRVDLLLSDVVMPAMSGRVLADRIAALRPDTRVLFVSGYTSNEIARHGVLEQGVELLEKPFTPQALLQRVQAVLRRPPPAPRAA